MAAFAAIAGMSAALNLPWALAMVSSGVSELGTQPYQRSVDVLATFRELAGVWAPGSMGAKLFVGLVAASVYAALCASEAHVRKLSRAGLLAWLLLSLFAHLGAAVPLVGGLQPNRFSSVA